MIAFPECFGAPKDPPRVSEEERSLAPLSLQILESETAKWLSQYMGSAVNGLRIPAVNHSVLPILWAIDVAGTFRFALEEVVDTTNQQFMYPLSRHLATPAGHAKLGHPSLLEGTRSARIAGEIVYDPEFGVQGWVITNRSGRYGLVKGVERSHLEAAARELDNYDIRVDVYFVQPVR